MVAFGNEQGRLQLGTTSANLLASVAALRLL
jgi:hypothetical protein